MKRLDFLLALPIVLFTIISADVVSVTAGQELIVSAATSLTNAFGDIGKNFEAANPGTKVLFNFAASGALLQQIDKGAPVDVFASADQKTMDQAGEKGLILPATRRDFAGNELVLIVPGKAGTSLSTLGDLAGREVARIAIGNPESVPVGRYTQEVLTSDGTWRELGPKIILADSARQVLDYVSRGEVDAGFVFATDAVLAKDKVKVVLEAKNHKPVTYPISVVSSTRNMDLSKRFVDFVLSNEGREIFSKYGFKGP